MRQHPLRQRAIALGAVFVGIACNDAAPAVLGVDASVDDGGGSSDSSFTHFTGTADGATVDAAVPVTVEDAALGVDLDATDLDGAGPDPDPASCGGDAGGDAGFCGLPPSRCADSRWLVYYDDGQCILGQCAWEKRYVDCAAIGCFYGACRVPVTR